MKKILFQETRNGPLTESQEEEEVLWFHYPVCTVLIDFGASEMCSCLQGAEREHPQHGCDPPSWNTS